MKWSEEKFLKDIVGDKLPKDAIIALWPSTNGSIPDF